MNERITELRKTLSLSMEEFGKKLGVTRSSISNIESGRRGLTDQMSHRLHYPVQQKSLKANSFLMLRLKKHQLLEMISIQTFLTHQRNWRESSRHWKIRRKKKAGLGRCTQSSWSLS